MRVPYPITVDVERVGPGLARATVLVGGSKVYEVMSGVDDRPTALGELADGVVEEWLGVLADTRRAG